MEEDKEQFPDSEVAIYEEDLTELADLDEDSRQPEDGEGRLAALLGMRWCDCIL